MNHAVLKATHAPGHPDRMWRCHRCGQQARRIRDLPEDCPAVVQGVIPTASDDELIAIIREPRK